MTGIPHEDVRGKIAAILALEAIKDRSFAGRNPHLGKMLNCPFCNLRHRENERKCVQKFATETREGDPIQGELTPPEGLTHLTARQILGAARFNKTRRKPRQRPQKPMTYWEKILRDAQKKKVD